MPDLDGDDVFPEFDLFEASMGAWDDEPVKVCDLSDPELCEACD